VAEEVRNLAMCSAEAARNTSALIQESVKSAKSGVEIGGEVGRVLDAIVEKVSKTSTLFSEIAAASAEQAQGIEQITTAVGQMDKVTQQNAANAEESSSASGQLTAQAESMNKVIAELLPLVGSCTAVVDLQVGQSGQRGKRASPGDSITGYGMTEGLGRYASDDAFHQIAHGSRNRVPARRSPDSTMECGLPLDEGDDPALRAFHG
jgi:methyl-accepting chemotaxis protein